MACVWVGAAQAADGTPMNAIWERLARAHVMAQVNYLGLEEKAGAAPRWGWELALQELDRAAQADPSLLTRIDLVTIDEADAQGEAAAREAQRPVPAVVLSLRVSRKGLPLSWPDAAAIKAAVGERPPRTKADFDERFPLWLARSGLGCLTPDRRTCGPALRALGEQVAAHPLESLRAALEAKLDPHAMPQVYVDPAAAAPKASFFATPSAAFPSWIARSRMVAAFTYRDGKVPDLVAFDALCKQWLERQAKARGTPAEKAILEEGFSTP